jgi:hypothetical protein
LLIAIWEFEAVSSPERPPETTLKTENGWSESRSDFRCHVTISIRLTDRF